MPNNWVLGVLVPVIVVQVLGKYMNMRCLDPEGVVVVVVVTIISN